MHSAQTAFRAEASCSVEALPPSLSLFAWRGVYARSARSQGEVNTLRSTLPVPGAAAVVRARVPHDQASRTVAQTAADAWRLLACY